MHKTFSRMLSHMQAKSVHPCEKPFPSRFLTVSEFTQHFLSRNTKQRATDYVEQHFLLPKYLFCGVGKRLSDIEVLAVG